jgi:DNA recombination protein RmuC
VKTEFAKYGDVMDRVKKRLEQATTEIENVAVRRRAIDRKRRGVETISEIDAASLLTLSNPTEDTTAEDAA